MVTKPVITSSETIDIIIVAKYFSLNVSILFDFSNIAYEYNKIQIPNAKDRKNVQTFIAVEKFDVVWLPLTQSILLACSF